MALLDTVAGGSLAVRVRPAAWAAAAVAALVAASLTALVAVVAVTRTLWGADGSGADFAALYAAASLVRNGAGELLYDGSAQELVQRIAYSPADLGREGTYALPPAVATLLAPLSKLSFDAAYATWMAINLVTLAAILLVLRRHLQGVPPLPRRVFLGIFAVSTPVLTDIALGTTDLFVFAGLFGGYMLMRRDRAMLAGAALSLAMVKPHLLIGVVLMLVIWRQWDTLLAMAGIGTAVLVVPSLVVAGVGGTSDGLALSLRHLGGSVPADATSLASWRAISATITGSDARWLWMPPSLAIAAVTAAMCIERWRASEFGEEPADRSYALAVLLPLAVLPAVGLQSAVLLFIPAVMALRAWFHPGAAQDDERQLDVSAAMLALYAGLTAVWLATVFGASLAWLVTLAALWACAQHWPVPEAARAPVDPLTRLRELNLTRSSGHRYDRAGSRL
jgi:hypothetical protein